MKKQMTGLNGFIPNCFEKPKAGGLFYFLVKLAETLIRELNPA
jgi:hypothetical protein